MQVRRKIYLNKTNVISIQDRNKEIGNMKSLKKVLLSLLAITMLLSFTACSSDSEDNTEEDAYAYLVDTTDLIMPELDLSDADGVLASVLEDGVLKVATSPDFPPLEWVEDDGTLYGAELMLAKYIADCLGVDLEIETMDFTSTFAAVDTGKVDIALSGYGWKSDRAESYNLTVGYQDGTSDSGGHTLLVLAEDVDNYSTLEDFVGKTIVAQANSLQEMYVEDQILALDTEGTTTYEAVSTLDQAVLSLQSGKCDAVALTVTTATNYANSSDGLFAVTGILFDLSIYPDSEGYCGLIKKGEDSFTDVVDTIIECAKDNGYFVEWYEQAAEMSSVE